MALKFVTSNTPGQQAINSLMSNNLILDGKTDRALFNKLEIDDLYNKFSPRKYTRDVELGHTTSSYTNWTHIVSDSGYSVWSHPVSTYVDNANNELYLNDIKLLYMGSATTESTLLGFNKVYRGTSKRSGETFTNLTTEASTSSGTPFSIVSGVTVTNEAISATFSTFNLSYLNIIEGSLTVSKTTFSATYVENSDYTVNYRLGTITILSSGDITAGTQLYVNFTAGNTIYVGCSATFTLLNTGLATKGVANTFKYDYSSGAAWHNFTPSLDSTNHFSVNGNINISGITGWTTATVNAISGLYWLKIRIAQLGLNYPTLYSLTRADNAATKLVAMSQVDLDQKKYKWAYFNGKVYVTIPNDGDTINEGVTYIKSSSNTDKKQNYFVFNNEYLTSYQIPVANTITINSNVYITQNLTVGGNFNISGAIVMSGNFGVTGNVTVSGLVKLANGTSAAPSLTFTSDTDTGIYRISANTLGISTAGVKKITISSGGNLIVTGTTTAGGFISIGDITINTNKFNVAGATGNTLIAGTLGVTGLITGTLATAAQTNITSVGTLTGLSLTATTAFSTYISSTGTNRVFSLYSNTGGNMYVGRENSTGNGLVTNGGSAYACVLGTSDNLYPLQFFTQDTVRMTIATTGDVTFTKKINTSDATDSTSGSTGSIYTAGGLGVTKSLYVGNYIGVGISPSSSYLLQTYTTGAVEQACFERYGGTAATRGKTRIQHSNIGYSGGTGADCLIYTDWGYSFYVNGQSSLTPALTIQNDLTIKVLSTAASTSTTTGALVVSGGVGIAESMYVGTTGTFGNQVLISHTNLNEPLDLYRNSGAINDLNGINFSFRNSNSAKTTYGNIYSYLVANTAGAESGGLQIYTKNAGTNSLRLTITNIGDVSIASTTASTSTTTGALVVAGGVGIATALTVGAGKTSIGANANTGFSTDYSLQVGTTDGVGATNGGLMIRAGQTGIGKLSFSDGASADGEGRIWYENTNNAFKFYTNNATLALTLDSSQNAIFGADAYSVAWTDYSATSTVTGWSSFGTKSIYYKRVGKLVFVYFRIDGTSNTTGASFTLPVSATTGSQHQLHAIAQDNGGTLAMDRFYWSNSSTVEFYSDIAGTGFTASGAKLIMGQFWYEAT